MLPLTQSIAFLSAGGIVSLALAIVLAWLTARDVAQRRRDQEMRAAVALDAIEERCAIAVEAAGLGTFSWDLRRDEFSSSQRSRDFLNLSDASQRGGEWLCSSDRLLGGIHPSDRSNVDAAFRACAAGGPALDLEFRVIAPGGGEEWRRLIGRAQPSDRPGPGVIQGVIADIGIKKRAEAERRELQRQLQAVQEGEQRRIARELHDQIGQTVTGLILGLKSLDDALTDKKAVPELRERVKWLQSLGSTIGRDIHQVATELRPTALDDLGLHRAIASLGSEWEQRYGLRVDLQVIGEVARLPPEFETAIYRIVQEALTNVLKHAYANAVSVVLKRTADRLSVIIEDDGIGLYARKQEASAVPNGNSAGLGLSGIRERLALVGGDMTIESELGAGTAIFIDLPIPGANEVTA